MCLGGGFRVASLWEATGSTTVFLSCSSTYLITLQAFPEQRRAWVHPFGRLHLVRRDAKMPSMVGRILRSALCPSCTRQNHQEPNSGTKGRSPRARLGPNGIQWLLYRLQCRCFFTSTTRTLSKGFMYAAISHSCRSTRPRAESVGVR